MFIKNNSEVAIMILAGDPVGYKQFIELIKSGWYQKAIDHGFKVFFYSGGHENDYIFDSCEIRVKEDDAIHNCYRKFISAKNVLKKYHPEIKLIFRTNVSSFIDVDNFDKYIRKLSFSRRSLHGIKGSTYLYSEKFYKNKYLHLLLKYLRLGPKINFYSGAGLFIGIQLCDELSFHDDINYLIDDVEIGYQLTRFVTHDIKYERVYITEDFKKIDSNIFFNMVNDGLLFHYKFKTSDRSQDAFLLGKFSDPQFRIAYLTF